jgi:hypothetical protein
MKSKMSLLAVAVTLICCVSIIWFSGSIQGSQRTYEVQPNLTIPEYKTDIVRVIDAYERLMDRYIDMTERNLTGVDGDLQTVIMKMDSIDNKLTELNTRTARIEKALGIDTTQNIIDKNITTQTGADNKLQKRN